MPADETPQQSDSQPWTPQDEENLLLEIAEDSRLRRLGIDPDGDSVDIMINVHELAEAYRIKPRKG